VDGFSYALLILLLVVSYFGGLLFPFGLLLVLITLFCGICLTVIHTIYAVNEKRFGFLVLSLIPIMISAVLGFYVHSQQRERTEVEIRQIRDYVNYYYKDKNVLPDTNEDFFHEYKGKIKLDNQGDGNYTLYYKDAIMHNYDDSIQYRY